MLTIRAEQFKAFSDQGWDSFQNQAVVELLSQFGSFLRGNAPERRILRAKWALAKGRAFGLTDGDDFIVFAGLVLQYGPHFEDHPMVSKMLRRYASLEPGEKLSNLMFELPEYAWNELSLLNMGDTWAEVENITLPSFEYGGVT
jgi:hypothetical protein